MFNPEKLLGGLLQGTSRKGMGMGAKAFYPGVWIVMMVTPKFIQEPLRSHATALTRTVTVKICVGVTWKRSEAVW